MIHNAKFISTWEYGTVTTPCKFNDETGEVFDIEHTDGTENLGTLIQQYITYDVGDDQERIEEEHDVCMLCHTHILVSVMQDNPFDKCMNEEWKCMNPECESNHYYDV